MSVIIKAVNVTKKVIKPSLINILCGISMEINQHETIAIVGQSGSGKTTLLGLLAGLDLPSSGEIFYHQKALHNLSEDGRAKLRLGKIGFVFQNFDLMPHFVALENVMLPLELAGIDSAKKIAQNILNQVGLKNRDHHYPAQLSGGEQQRVAIARAFAINPEILFADEPTGSLDTNTGDEIMDLLFDLNKKMGTTIVVVTHDESLSRRCQKCYRLISGKIQE